MGVSGCGKSTLGAALAAHLGWDFVEGDAHHPAANVAKMRSGTPLNDADRAPWLAALAQMLSTQPQIVLSCSALKASYRAVLAGTNPSQVLFVHVQGSFEEISARLARAAHGDRAGHYMPNTLLQSQFDALELPQEPSIHSISVGFTQTTAQQINAVATHWLAA